MKRTEPQVIRTSFFKFYEGADDFYDIYPAEDLLYGSLADQLLKISAKINKIRATYIINCYKKFFLRAWHDL